MASINKVILIGNLGADPEIRYTPDGDAVCTLRLATTEKWQGKSSERREATEWHRIVLFRRLAEAASQYLKKGAAVYLEGRLRTRKWQDRDGMERYTTEIEGIELKMLGGPRSDTQTASLGSNAEPEPWANGNSTAVDWAKDLPF